MEHIVQPLEQAKSNRGFICAMAALLLCQLAVLLFFGSKKAGFHEDELYIAAHIGKQVHPNPQPFTEKAWKQGTGSVENIII